MATSQGQARPLRFEAIRTDGLPELASLVVHEPLASPRVHRCQRPRRALLAALAAALGLAAAACVAGRRRSWVARPALQGPPQGGQQEWLVPPQPIPDWAEDDQVTISLCFDDTWQAMGRLGQAVIAADVLKDNCKGPLLTSKARAICSATITGFITQITLLAALLSDAASACGLKTIDGAVCSSRIGGFIGNVAAAMGAAANLYHTCDFEMILPWRLCESPVVERIEAHRERMQQARDAWDEQRNASAARQSRHAAAASSSPATPTSWDVAESPNATAARPSYEATAAGPSHAAANGSHESVPARALQAGLRAHAAKTPTPVRSAAKHAGHEWGARHGDVRGHQTAALPGLQPERFSVDDMLRREACAERSPPEEEDEEVETPDANATSLEKLQYRLARIQERLEDWQERREERRQELEDQMVALKAEIEARRSRQRSEASCFFDIVQATGFFVRTGLAIRSAILMCDPVGIEENDMRRKCSVSVLGAIGSYALGVQFVGGLLNNCPVEGLSGAACTRDVAGMIGTLAAVFTFGVDLGAACDGEYPEGSEPFENEPIANLRRLQQLPNGTFPEAALARLLKPPRMQ